MIKQTINTVCIKRLDYFIERAFNISESNSLLIPVIHNNSILPSEKMMIVRFNDINKYCENRYTVLMRDNEDSSIKISYRFGWWVYDSWVNNY